MKKLLLLIFAALIFQSCTKCFECTRTCKTASWRTDHARTTTWDYTEEYGTPIHFEVCGNQDIKNAEKPQWSEEENPNTNFIFIIRTTCTCNCVNN